MSAANMAITALVQSIQPVQDVAAQVVLSSWFGNSGSFSFTTPILISTVALGQIFTTPQIDEPVTGIGNDDLWVGSESVPPSGKADKVGIGLGRELALMGGKKKEDAIPK